MNQLLTPNQIASLINCKTSSVYAWAKRGKIPALKLNGILRFDIKEVEEWITSNRIRPVNIAVPKVKEVTENEIDRIVDAAIDSVRGSSYNADHKGKPDLVKSQKGGDNGSI